MKANKKFGFVSAIALASVVGFSACSENELAEANQGEGETVKTQFAISVTNKANKTRMTAGQAQEGGEFNGIKNIKLYQYTVPVSAGTEKPAVITDLTAIDAFNYQNSAEELNTKVYSDVAVQSGVSNFLFYGETAVASNGGNTTTDYATAGEAANATTFTPTSIYAIKSTETNAQSQTFSQALSFVLDKLNALLPLFDATGLPATVKLNKEVLLDLASASSESVRELVQDIYNDIETQNNGLPAGSAGKTETETLLANILSTGGFTATGAVGEKVLAWVNDPEFPTFWGLPAGAVGVKVESGSFVANKVSTDGMSVDYEKFVFPASLFYYVNTPAGVRNASYFEVPTGGSITDASADNWEKLTTNFDMTSVTAATRSIILWNQVQYGVAHLATNVKFALGEIKDSKGNVVTIPTEGFNVTGILVGNQKQVDWQFKQVSTADAYTLYDGVSTGTVAAKSNAAEGTFQTLVYESYEATAEGDTDADVTIAIEMENNSGKDFFGVNDEKIPAGAKFYLTAKLDFDAASNKDFAKYKSIFMQDYVTTANLTISSLKGAYNVIPDLRTTALELGISVDLLWTPGLVFDVPIP